jgi:integrase
VARVWKHPKSKFWFARFRDAENKRVNRSTGQTSRSKALILAEQWERAGRAARAGKLTRAKAKSVLDEILEQTGQEPIPSATIEEVFKDWLKEVESEKSESTSNRYRVVSGKFLEHLGPRASAPAVEITSADLQSFITARGRNRAAKTADNDLRCLAAAFNRAYRLGTIDRNPCLSVKAPEGASIARKPFDPSHVALLVAAAPSREWRTLIMTCWFTGLRIGDASTLEWKEVDLARGIITRIQQKTGGEVVIPMHPELREELEAIAGDVNGPILPELSQTKVGGKRGLSAQFGEIVLAAGLDEERQKSKSGRTLARYSAHSLRHGATSALANAGVHADIRKEITGHSDDKSHQRYTHHSVEIRREAVGKIPGLKAPPPP